MADLKAPGFALRSFGAIRAEGPVVASLVDSDAAYVDFDSTGIGYGRVGVKRNGAGTSGGLKLRTLNAGAAVDAVTFAANGAATFAAAVTMISSLSVTGSMTLAATLAVGAAVTLGAQAYVFKANDFQLMLDASGQYTNLIWAHGGVIAAQVLWDNTNSKFGIVAPYTVFSGRISASLPTSAAGLVAGDLWRNGTVVNIV